MKWWPGATPTLSQQVCGSRTGLLLSGGGARAAYQVGVLKAIAEMLPSEACNPFPILCGTSAGALNASMLASHANNFPLAVYQLEQLWGGLTSEQVTTISYRQLLGSTLKLIGSFFFRGRTVGRPLSLLDNSPLHQLLIKHVNLHAIQPHIDSGQLHALCLTALSYHSGESMSFFQAHKSQPNWHRPRRHGINTTLSHKHLLASSALPGLFPAIQLGHEYYGDGAMRQSAPISPLLHLGANRLLIIGVGNMAQPAAPLASPMPPPSLAEIFSQLMNSAFIDTLEEDIHMMDKFNRVAELLTTEQQRELNLQPISLLNIQPSIDFAELAFDYMHELPPAMRRFLSTIGATRRDGNGGEIASYLMFEGPYCRELINHGYRDCMQQAWHVKQFLDGIAAEEPTAGSNAAVS